MALGATFHRPKKANSALVSSSFAVATTACSFRAAVFFFLFAASVVFLLLRLSHDSTSPCSSAFTSKATGAAKPFSGDLRYVDFAWNSLAFKPDRPPPTVLRIAVFSRKWPIASAPGGMERHALTLHSALARRGHDVHVFTSAASGDRLPVSSAVGAAEGAPRVHFLTGSNWRCQEAWDLFEAEARAGGPFDVVHSESVALLHRLARDVPNLAVSWHGISLEVLQSSVYQDLIRPPSESMSQDFNRTLARSVYKLLDEIRFFQSYEHHVAISDSMGQTLRDMYQIPSGRVHVILNGVDEEEFRPDAALGEEFRREIGLPKDAQLVMGVAGRLVRDKGHPLLFEAFSKLVLRHPNLYLVAAGSGPWAQRYKDKLGANVVLLGAVPPSKLREFYGALDVFVDPTLRPQGLDLTLMEAMQSGKPVAATRLPSITGSILVDEEFGFTFAPNAEALYEALERVVGEGRARLAERGRACRDYAASMFTATKMALAYERLFLCIKNEAFCKYPSAMELHRSV